MIIIRLLVFRESRNQINSPDDFEEGGVVQIIGPDDEKGSVKQNKADEK